MFSVGRQAALPTRFHDIRNPPLDANVLRPRAMEVLARGSVPVVPTGRSAGCPLICTAGSCDGGDGDNKRTVPGREPPRSRDLYLPVAPSRRRRLIRRAALAIVPAEIIKIPSPNRGRS